MLKVSLNEEGRKKFVEAAARFSEELLAIVLRQNHVPTFQACEFLVKEFETESCKFLEQHFQAKGYVRLSVVGWTTFPRIGTGIASSQLMEDAIIRCLKAILTVQGKGATLADLWSSIGTMHKMPESPAELQSLQQIHNHTVSGLVLWKKILLKDEYYSLPPAVLPPSSQSSGSTTVPSSSLNSSSSTPAQQNGALAAAASSSSQASGPAKLEFATAAKSESTTPTQSSKRENEQASPSSLEPRMKFLKVPNLKKVVLASSKGKAVGSNESHGPPWSSPAPRRYGTSSSASTKTDTSLEQDSSSKNEAGKVLDQPMRGPHAEPGANTNAGLSPDCAESQKLDQNNDDNGSNDDDEDNDEDGDEDDDEDDDEESNDSTTDDTCTSVDLQMHFLPFVENLCQKRVHGVLLSRPVDPTMVPDYRRTVKKPMDFGTIKTKLKAGRYSTPWTVANDICLVFNNAWRYNRPETPAYKSANVGP